ncbi:WxL protein peptidoglycan domain-containing protein [Microbacterium sp. NPDC056003]|uniref:WxL protein peptidoglycan domain-containing protein n=1 Tax=Microbacterium sp. NPDC056003 TaxID=3345676 RepID=UPI0035D80695
MLPLSSRLRPARHALAGLALGLALVAGVAVPASADTDDTPDVRWSVTPANESGPDGRTFVENELDPGESVDDYFAVRNVSDQTVEFALLAADGFYTSTGRFDILPAGEESVDAGTWISVPETVTVDAGETAVVPFTITVPEQAEPGDHAAGITASIVSVQESEDGTAVGVESRVGFRVTTRVTGEITPSATVDVVSGDYSLSWNPFRPGEATITFRAENTGNTILLAEGTVSAGGGSTEFPAEGERTLELLPGDSRDITVVVEGVWPLFVVPASVVVTPTVVTMNGDNATIEPITADTVVWAVPWPQLIILAGLVLVVWAIVWGRIRSRRRLESMLEDAKAAGRREAESAADAS